MSFSYAIVIVTYNRLELLKECIQHAINQTIKPKNIIVVDNCCTDGSDMYLDEISKTIPELIVAHEAENLGGAGGFNHGLRLAFEKTAADWFMIIDDDAILEYSCMEYMNPLKVRVQSKAYACTVMCEGKIDISHRRNIDGILPEEQYTRDEFQCELATFCGLMINRQLIEKVGYPKAEYFIWLDDTEYSMRICRYSDIIVLPQAVLNHKTKLEPKISSSTMFSWKTYYGRRNTIDVYKRHHMWKQLALHIARSIRDIIKLWAKDRTASKLIFDAVIDGVTGKLGKNIQYMPGKK